MKLTLLGTGNATVTKCYNTCFVISDENGHFLVDAGGGNEILKRLEQAGIPLSDVRDIFVTHKHIDHILGVIWMIRMITQSMNQGKYEGEARIYGHKEVIDLLIDISGKLIQKKEVALIGKRLHMIVVEDGDELMVCSKPVTFFDIRSTKAKQFGFMMKYCDGKRLCCCGDEPYAEHEEVYARDCDWLLHEAFCLHSQADIFKPYEKNHSTAKDACELAQRLNVKNLILYHTEDKNIENRRELYIEEGRPYYEGNILVPDDMEVIDIV